MKYFSKLIILNFENLINFKKIWNWNNHDVIDNIGIPTSSDNPDERVADNWINN